MTATTGPHRRGVRGLFALLLAASVLAPGAPVAAWGNGSNEGNGYGTHDWIIDQAVKVTDGRVGSWFNAQVARLSSDDPDTIEAAASGSTNDHVYRGTSLRGGGVERIATEYDLAQAAYTAGAAARAGGDEVAAVAAFDEASHHVGLLAHILGDLSQPFHSSYDAIGRDTLHSSYESLVASFIRRSTDMPEWQSTRRTVTTIGNVRTVAVGTAAYSRSRWTELLNRLKQDGARMTAGLSSLTGSVLKRASNDLADIIWTISAGEGAQPTLGSLKVKVRWTGVAAKGGQLVEVWAKDTAGRPIEGLRVLVTWPTDTGSRVERLYTDGSGYQKRYGYAGTTPRVTQLPVVATAAVRDVSVSASSWWAITPTLASGTAGFKGIVADSTVIVGQVATVTAVARKSSGAGVPNLLVTFTWKLADGATVRTRAITDSKGRAVGRLTIGAGMAAGRISVAVRTQSASRNRTVWAYLKRV